MGISGEALGDALGIPWGALGDPMGIPGNPFGIPRGLLREHLETFGTSWGSSGTPQRCLGDHLEVLLDILIRCLLGILVFGLVWSSKGLP